MFFECVCGLETESQNFFVELLHVCERKSCVKKLCGRSKNEINHCLKSRNKHAIKLMSQ